MMSQNYVGCKRTECKNNYMGGCLKTNGITIDKEGNCTSKEESHKFYE